MASKRKHGDIPVTPPPDTTEIRESLPDYKNALLAAKSTEEADSLYQEVVEKNIDINEDEFAEWTRHLNPTAQKHEFLAHVKATSPVDKREADELYETVGKKLGVTEKEYADALKARSKTAEQRNYYYKQITKLTDQIRQLRARLSSLESDAQEAQKKKGEIEVIRKEIASLSSTAVPETRRFVKQAYAEGVLLDGEKIIELLPAWKSARETAVHVLKKQEDEKEQKRIAVEEQRKAQDEARARATAERPVEKLEKKKIELTPEQLQAQALAEIQNITSFSKLKKALAQVKERGIELPADHLEAILGDIAQRTKERVMKEALQASNDVLARSIIEATKGTRFELTPDEHQQLMTQREEQALQERLEKHRPQLVRQLMLAESTDEAHALYERIANTKGVWLEEDVYNEIFQKRATAEEQRRGLLDQINLIIESGEDYEKRFNDIEKLVQYTFFASKDEREKKGDPENAIPVSEHAKIFQQARVALIHFDRAQRHQEMMQMATERMQTKKIKTERQKVDEPEIIRALREQQEEARKERKKDGREKEKKEHTEDRDFEPGIEALPKKPEGFEAWPEDLREFYDDVKEMEKRAEDAREDVADIHEDIQGHHLSVVDAHVIDFLRLCKKSLQAAERTIRNFETMRDEFHKSYELYKKTGVQHPQKRSFGERAYETLRSLGLPPKRKKPAAEVMERQAKKEERKTERVMQVVEIGRLHGQLIHASETGLIDRDAAESLGDCITIILNKKDRKSQMAFLVEEQHLDEYERNILYAVQYRRLSVKDALEELIELHPCTSRTQKKSEQALVARREKKKKSQPTPKNHPKTYKKHRSKKSIGKKQD